MTEAEVQCEIRDLESEGKLDKLICLAVERSFTPRDAGPRCVIRSTSNGVHLVTTDGVYYGEIGGGLND